jgi:acyl dehydratase
VTTRRLDGPPGMAGLYGRVALGALPGAGVLPFVGGRGSELPDLELALTGIEVDTARLADYCRVCGFTLRDSLPPTYPHVLSFPLQMRLMADGGFPFPLLGLVHLDNAITQHRPIRATEALDLSVLATDLRPHPKGRAFSLVAEARTGGELVWEERGTILRRGGGGDPDAPRDPRPEPVADDAPAVTEWKLGDDLGRRYAGVSGDRNPIHMHSLSAKAFGFPRAIAHGMWSQARCLAQIEGRLSPAFVTRATFGRPLLLPARVRFAVEERAGGAVGFAMRDAREGTEHLLGDLTPR